jgi:hypothetical protein
MATKKKKTTAKRKPSKSAWTFKQHQPNTHSIDFGRMHRDSRRIALMSDLHWDNPHCMLDRLAQDMQAAVDQDAPIMLFGDTFCAMQGRWDRRANKSCLRPEHQVDSYLDALVATCADWLEPYLSHICLVGLGNHETSILTRHETCLITRLVERCKMIDPSSPISKGGYGGWVKIQGQYGANEKHTTRTSLDMHYFHGAGGGGPVTKGVIQQQRFATMVDADIVCQGHVHERQYTEFVKVRLEPRSMKERVYTQHHIRCSTYKEEFSINEGNSWHRNQGRPPKPIGGWWLDLEILRRHTSKDDQHFMQARPTPMT